MSEPRWFTKAEIERLHGQLIKQTGGSQGLRDSSLLESALARPRNLQAYGERDVFQLAASYAESLSRNHAFVDGNKRVGFSAAGIFLMRNGRELLPSRDNDHAAIMEKVAQGQVKREEFAKYLQENSRMLQKVQQTEESFKVPTPVQARPPQPVPERPRRFDWTKRAERVPERAPEPAKPEPTRAAPQPEPMRQPKPQPPRRFDWSRAAESALERPREPSSPSRSRDREIDR